MSTEIMTRTEKKHKKLDNILKSSVNLRPLQRKKPYDDIFTSIYEATQDIHDAQNFFDNVTESELIDHAIYRLEAAKTKYSFLIKKAKDIGIKVNI